jgi:hypothetical protein
VKVYALLVLGFAQAAAAQSFPFAGGPVSQVAQAEAAARKCRADVRFQEADAGRVLIFLSEGKRFGRQSRCLSRWLMKQPDDGFQKYGFIGREDNRVAEPPPEKLK